MTVGAVAAGVGVGVDAAVFVASFGSSSPLSWKLSQPPYATTAARMIPAYAGQAV